MMLEYFSKSEIMSEIDSSANFRSKFRTNFSGFLRASHVYHASNWNPEANETGVWAALENRWWISWKLRAAYEFADRNGNGHAKARCDAVDYWHLGCREMSSGSAEL